MEQKTKVIIGGLIGTILILVGIICGYWFKEYSDSNKMADLPVLSGTLPNLKPPQVGDTDISQARNTPIVQAVKQVAPAVVGITAKVYNRDIFNRKVLVSEGLGSGVIFDERGYIVTNNHVVEGATGDEVAVTLMDGSTLAGRVIGRDAQTDLAVVKVDKTGLPVAVFGNSDELQIGEPAIAIGNPLGLEFQGSVTAGVISAVSRTLNGQEQRFPLLQTDAAINPGNSGGALVNAEGRVIGINSAKIAHEGIEGIGFAIPINQARPILKSLIDNGKVVRAYVGMWTVDKQTAAQYGYEASNEGLTVLKIAGNSPAEKAGFEEGDVIISVDGKTITSLVDFKSAIDSHRPGEKMTIVYERNGTRREVILTLAVMPENNG